MTRLNATTHPRDNQNNRSPSKLCIFIAALSIYCSLLLMPVTALGTEYFVIRGDFDGNGSVDRGSILRHLTTGEARVKLDLMKRGRVIGVEVYDLGGFKYDLKNQRWFVSDVDGDGQVDIVLVYGSKGRAMSTVFQYKHEFQNRKVKEFAGWWPSQKWSMRDVNQDGRMDLVNRYKGKQGAREWVHYGNADATFEYCSLLRDVR